MGRALVLGGAGFVGSAIVRRLLEADWQVSVIDGFLPGTFANEDYLTDVVDRIDFIKSSVASVPDLVERAHSADVVVDSMGWTRHREAEQNPMHDLSLNLASHLVFLHAVATAPPRRTITIGSRHQFGVQPGVLDDDAPFAPIDVQSIHKCAAEHHFRLFAERTDSTVIAVRVGNCFGPGLSIGPGDVGLIGSFVRDLLDPGVLQVFDGRRIRNLAYTLDIAELVFALCTCPLRGFVGLNYPGQEVQVRDLAAMLVRTLGKGSIEYIRMPADVAAREIGAGVFCSSRLLRLVPAFKSTPLDAALAKSVADVLAKTTSTARR